MRKPLTPEDFHDADESEEGVARIKFEMSKKWDQIKEVGSNTVMNYVAMQRGITTSSPGIHPPALRNGRLMDGHRQPIESVTIGGTR